MSDLITSPEGTKFRIRVQGNLAKVCQVITHSDGAEVDGTTVAFFRHIRRLGWVDQDHKRFHEDHCQLAVLVLRDLRNASLERSASIVRPVA